jgi:hypothetical protein
MKQTGVINLTLVVTDRARKLRAQYSVMSSSLRARLEMRINRIPTSLRSTTMGELIDRYSESLEAKPKPLPIPIAKATYPAVQHLNRPEYRPAVLSPAREKGTKRSR